MRRRLEALGAPVPRYAEVTDVADVDAFAARVGEPIVVKTVRGGYDGRGVLMAARPGTRPATSPARYLADGRRRCWSRSAWRCGANWPRWWRGRRSARARRGRWWRPCSATASASR